MRSSKYGPDLIEFDAANSNNEVIYLADGIFENEALPLNRYVKVTIQPSLGCGMMTHVYSQPIYGLSVDPPCAGKVVVYLKCRVNDCEKTKNKEIVLPRWVKNLFGKYLNILNIDGKCTSPEKRTGYKVAERVCVSKASRGMFVPTSEGIASLMEVEGGILEDIKYMEMKWTDLIRYYLDGRYIEDGCYVPVKIMKSCIVFKVNVCMEGSEVGTCIFDYESTRISIVCPQKMNPNQIQIMPAVYKKEFMAISNAVNEFLNHLCRYEHQHVLVTGVSKGMDVAEYVVCKYGISVLRLDGMNIPEIIRKCRMCAPSVLLIEELETYPQNCINRICRSIKGMNRESCDDRLYGKVMVISTSKLNKEEISKIIGSNINLYGVIVEMKHLKYEARKTLYWVMMCKILCKCKDVPGYNCLEASFDTGNALEKSMETIANLASITSGGYTVEELLRIFNNIVRNNVYNERIKNSKSINVRTHEELIESFINSKNHLINETSKSLDSMCLRGRQVKRVNINDIWGYDSVKNCIKMTCKVLKGDALCNKLRISMPNGILIHGPSGCGKSLIAKALITESKMNTIHIKTCDILSKYVGESENRLREVFNEARNKAPCILFVDPINSLIAKRGFSNDDSQEDRVEKRLLSTFLNELDGATVNRGVILVACIEEITDMDNALMRPGRFDMQIEIKKPTFNDRILIFNNYFEQYQEKFSTPIAIFPSSRKEIYDVLSHITHCFSVSDILLLAKEAVIGSINYHSQNKTIIPSVNLEDIIRILDRRKVSIGSVKFNNII